MTQARLTIKIWPNTNGGTLPDDLSNALTPHVEHVAKSCGQGYVAGEISDDSFTGWWDISTDADEVEQAKRGALLAEVLGLKRDKINKAHWATTWGSKTDLGLLKTIKRIIEEGK